MSTSTKKRLFDIVVICVMVVFAALLTWTLIALKIQTARVDALSSGLNLEQDAARDRGDEPVAPDPSDLIEDPGQDTDKGKDSASDTDVKKLVKEAVADYLAGVDFNDDDEITEADIVATVSNYLVKHGIKALDDKELAGIVGDEVTRQLQAKGDLTGPQGEKGETGEPGPQGETGPQGPGPTAEEIGQAVEAYIEAEGLPICPVGYEAQTRDVLTTTGTADSIICVAT